MNESKVAPCAHCGDTGSITLPPEIETIEAYYFGCWEQSGHYWRAKYHDDDRKIEARIPEALKRGRIDGGFCPGAPDPNDRLRRKSRPETVGEAKLTHVDGWTVLAWWDRSVDKRGACNSAIVALGTHDFTTMLAIGRAQFAPVFARQPTPVLVSA